LFKIISETRGAHCLAVVGHNPGLHDVAVQLIASGDVDARERVAEKLPTAGLVVIELAFDDWSRLHLHSGRLERFITPKLIAAATD
jgi:phosphohistidine phosphatase